MASHSTIEALCLESKIYHDLPPLIRRPPPLSIFGKRCRQDDMSETTEYQHGPISKITMDRRPRGEFDGDTDRAREDDDWYERNGVWQIKSDRDRMTVSNNDANKHCQIHFVHASPACPSVRINDDQLADGSPGYSETSLDISRMAFGTPEEILTPWKTTKRVCFRDGKLRYQVVLDEKGMRIGRQEIGQSGCTLVLLSKRVVVEQSPIGDMNTAIALADIRH